ncbi:MAG: hypothetical protein VX000_13490 [Myxococcota bacterium]|nr:hypothetical protein [Myxococcota bacterium]
MDIRSAMPFLVFGSLVGTPALAARGSEIAVLGVHVEGQSDDAARENAERLVHALEKAGSMVPVPPGELRARLAGREPLVIEGAFLGTGRDRLEEGRRLYDRAELEAAIPVLGEAADALTAGLAISPDTKDLVDALVLLGLSHLFSGDGDGASRVLERVAILDPVRELDPVNYPPKAIEFFTEVRQRVLDARRAELFVEMPGDAALFVDGKPSLSTVIELPPGVHHVFVEGADGRRASERIALEEGAQERLKIHMQTASLAKAGSTPVARAEQTERLYASLGRHAATGLLLVAGETPDRAVALQLYEPRTGNFSKTVTAEAGGDPIGSLVDLVPVLAEYVGEQGTLRADRVSSRTVALDVAANPLLASMLLDPEAVVETVTVTRETPWFVWAGVAAVAAGGAATAALLLTREAGGSTDDGQKTSGVIVVGPMPD